MDQGAVDELDVYQIWKSKRMNPKDLGSGRLEKHGQMDVSKGNNFYHGLDNTTNLGQLRLPFSLPERK